MRRSSRRLTITGSSVFSASTPVVSKDDGGGSPKWVSAEEAFTFKTPKFTKLTRRTTMTRQNIFEEENTIKEADENIDEGFRRPALILFSPPGMKTRSRRSSIYVGKGNDLSNNNISTAKEPPPAKIRKVNNVGTKDENNDVEKARMAVKKTNESFPSLLKDHDTFSSTNGKPGLKRPVDETDITLSSHKKLPPSLDAEVIVTDAKKVRKSGRHHVESVDVEISKNTTVSLQDIQTPQRNTRKNDALLQKSNGSHEDVEPKSIEQLSKMRSQIPENDSLSRVERDKVTVELKEDGKKTPKPDTLTTKDKDKKESAKAIKTAKPGRHHVESVDVEISKNTTVSSQDIQTPRRNTRKNDALKSIEQLSKMRSHIPENDSLSRVERDKVTVELKESGKKTPKPDTLTTKDKDKKESAKAVKTAKPDSLSTPRVKSASVNKGTKRFTSEKDDIDVVVKKMFSPSSFYSKSSKSVTSSSKFTSPNTVKSVSSPARAAIMRETLTAAQKSEVKSPGRKLLESSFSKKTPSRAAPKARKILGVATPSNIGNQHDEQKENRDKVEASHMTCDESMTSPSETEKKISFENEDENNVTLSHTSHSQWCTIL